VLDQTGLSVFQCKSSIVSYRSGHIEGCAPSGERRARTAGTDNETPQEYSGVGIGISSQLIAGLREGNGTVCL